MQTPRIFIATVIAMVAFAANSLLCRLALHQTRIDAATFTTVRVLSGATALLIISIIRRQSATKAGSWPSAVGLFVYAAAFSFAYITLPAAIGALLLFAAVQASMIFWGLYKGERLQARQFIGSVVAFAGLVILLVPGLSRPPIAGSTLMVIAGIAWGVYSLRGKAATDPAAETAGNFLRAAPMVVLLSLCLLPWNRLDSLGIVYAAVSGSVTSGLGYVIWYAALPHIKATAAATVQLSVPVLAALGGMLVLGEHVSARFVIAAIAVLGGIALVIAEKQTLSSSSLRR